MEKFIPYEKLSKKEKRKRDAMLQEHLGPAEPRDTQKQEPQSIRPPKGTEWIDESPVRAFCCFPVKNPCVLHYPVVQ